MCWPVVSWRSVVSEGCWDVVPGSYPACLLVLLLEQMNELTEALLHRAHAVHRAALQNPALTSCQRFQLKVFLYLWDKEIKLSSVEALDANIFKHYLIFSKTQNEYPLSQCTLWCLNSIVDWFTFLVCYFLFRQNLSVIDHNMTIMIN